MASNHRRWHTTAAGINSNVARYKDGIGGPARIGKAVRGTATALKGKSRRRAVLVLPWWGIMRVSAHAWDLSGVTSVISTRPIYKRVPGS